MFFICCALSSDPYDNVVDPAASSPKNRDIERSEAGSMQSPPEALSLPLKQLYPCEKIGYADSECFAQSHGLEIPWKDAKTSNVLTNDHGNAVIANFGGGNTIGWVDTDRCGAMAGTNRGH